ncbi:YtfJ family protein, partial [Serratia marcescens]|uniref:YtfJ family protein n=2 Tax=Serratia TaxID=613 RepID=UPI002414563C
MTLRRLLIFTLLLSPLATSAHNFVQGRPVAPIAIADRGELLLRNGDFSYRPWNSAKLVGKVRVIQYIAGRTSAKKKNSPLINAVKDANL